MASNYTENYQLPLWAADDAFLRTEFNDANEKIDRAIKEVAEMAAERPALQVGSYQGDGSTTNTHLAEMGVRPRFLMILSHNANQAHVLFLLGDAVLSKAGGSTVGVAPQVFRTDTGVTFESTYPSHAMNSEWTQYSYLALS